MNSNNSKLNRDRVTQKQRPRLIGSSTNKTNYFVGKHSCPLPFSGQLAWPLVVGNFAPELLNQLLIEWLFQCARVQENGALMALPCVIDKRLGSVDAAAEERRWPHPS